MALLVVHPRGGYSPTNYKCKKYIYIYMICENFLNKILANPNHKLFNLISISKKIPSYNLRNERTVDVPKFKTERFKNSLIASSLIVND